MKSVTGGCGFLSPSPSLSPFAFPVPVSLHIWISPPADKEQGSGWREEKGMDWGGEGKRRLEIGGRGVYLSQSSLHAGRANFTMLL